MMLMRWFRKLFFNMAYLSGSARWDTGITPPEVEEFLASHPPGRALDLGCGTGTNLVALGRAGWEAVGVDFVRRAVRQARARLRRERIAAEVHQDDVSRLSKVSGLFDLVLDIGCLHSLDAAQRQGYAQQLRRVLAPGGTYMLYAFQRGEDSDGTGIRAAELESLFGHLKLVRKEEGTDGPNRTSAWYWFVN